MHPTSADTRIVYTGFWRRTWASILDSLLLTILTYPILISLYGWEYLGSGALVKGPADFLVTWVIPTIAVILFWIYKSATPGKMAVGARIVDAQTGAAASNSQLIGRYFGYFVSLIPLGLGFFWVAFDARKQGWHDKLAGTVVVHTVAPRSESATFPAHA